MSLDRLVAMLQPPILNLIALLLVAVWGAAVLIDALSTSYNDSGSVSIALGVILGSLFTLAGVVHTKDKGGDE